MPSKSKKQARTMRAAAHSKEFADKMDIPQGVAREYVDEDREAKLKRAGRSRRGRSGDY